MSEDARSLMSPSWPRIAAGAVTAALLLGGTSLYCLGQPDDLGCRTARTAAGWQACVVRDHRVVGVGLTSGCSEEDAHAYEVVGVAADGSPAQAVVCCGAVVKACTVRAR
jgi:hypothetical protein